MHDKNINKYLYKIFLVFAKYLPAGLSVVYIINLVANYLSVNLTICMYLGGVSFPFICLLYLIAFVFKFCHLYKIPLYFLTFGNVVGALYSFKLIPITVIGMYRIYFIVTGLTIVLYIFIMYKNRNNPKIDPIKQLCETYCDCNCD